jgi:hypothetical protein
MVNLYEINYGMESNSMGYEQWIANATKKINTTRRVSLPSPTSDCPVYTPVTTRRVSLPSKIVVCHILFNDRRIY